MTIVLVLVSLALTVVARFVSDGKDCARSRPSLPACLALLATTIICIIVAVKFGHDNTKVALASGLSLGAVALLGSEWLGGLVAPVGVAVASTTILHFFPSSSIEDGQLGLLVGLSLGAICLGTQSGFTTAIVATACVAGDYLGAGHKNVPGSISMGSVIGLAMLIALIVSRLLPAKAASFRPVGIGIVVAAAGFGLATRIAEPHLAIVVGIASLTGIVLHFLAPDEERDVLRLIIAGVIAMSVATIAYSFYRNAGVAAALLAMLAVLVGSRNRTGVLTTSLVFGLVLFRLVQKVDIEFPQSLDIGQHYIFAGLMLGVLVPILPIERMVDRNWQGGLSSFLWSILLIATCIIIEVMMGHRGIMGFVAGFGLSGMVVTLRPERSLLPLAITPGLVGVSLFCLDRFSDWTELSKDDKVKFVLIGGTIAVALAAGIAFLARKPKVEVPA